MIYSLNVFHFLFRASLLFHIKRQVRWSGITISFIIVLSLFWYTVKGFGIVNKAEIDVFLELSCFFHDPADIGNLISWSSAFSFSFFASAFSKISLNIWKFTVNILLKPGLQNFEHYFTSVWDDCNYVVVWTFFGIALATHSSTLPWKIPWTEEPGRLQSMELQRVGHDWKTSLVQDWNENWPFTVLWPLLSFPDLLAYWHLSQHYLLGFEIVQLEFYHLY